MNSGQLEIRETTEGIIVKLHVQPRAKASQICGIHNGALKLKVTAPPVDDAANRAIIEFFSSLLGVSKGSLQIGSGLKSRDKTLQIRGFSRQAFLEKI